MKYYNLAIERIDFLENHPKKIGKMIFNDFFETFSDLVFFCWPNFLGCQQFNHSFGTIKNQGDDVPKHLRGGERGALMVLGDVLLLLKINGLWKRPFIGWIHPIM